MDLKAIKDRLAAYDDLEVKYDEVNFEKRTAFSEAKTAFAANAMPDIRALVKRVEELEAAIQKVLAIRKSSTQPESTKLDEEWVDGYNDILAKIQLYLKIVVKKNSVC